MSDSSWECFVKIRESTIQSMITRAKQIGSLEEFFRSWWDIANEYCQLSKVCHDKGWAEMCQKYDQQSDKARFRAMRMLLHTSFNQRKSEPDTEQRRLLLQEFDDLLHDDTFLNSHWPCQTERGKEKRTIFLESLTRQCQDARSVFVRPASEEQDIELQAERERFKQSRQLEMTMPKPVEDNGISEDGGNCHQQKVD